MQLADGGHLVPRIADPVMPGRDAAVIGERVVPIAGLMRMCAGGNGGTGRTAKGTGAIGVLEPDTAFGDAVDGRRFDHGMPGGAHKTADCGCRTRVTRFAAWVIVLAFLRLSCLIADFALGLAFVFGAVAAAPLEFGDHQVDELVDGARRMDRRQHETVAADRFEEGFHLVGNAFHRADELASPPLGRVGARPRGVSCRCCPVA